MRALLICALLSAGCAKTYEDMISAGDEVICPAEALCPGAQVCLTFEGEPRCKSHLACSVLKQDCASLYSSHHDYGNRKRCALMQTGDGQAAGECTQQYGEAGEGNTCSVQIVTTD